jgi:3-oxoacyl-[acyl-carrier-protein] synthase II
LVPLDPALSAGLAVSFGGRVADAALADAAGGMRVRSLADPALRECLASLPGSLRARTGLSVGSGLGSMERSEQLLAGEPLDLLSLHPHAITRELASSAGLGGPLGTYTVTCASALYALEQACAELERGRAPAMVCGGLETLSRTILAGFCALDALSKTAGPELPSPNDGIVLGEGACFVLLEPLDAARERGAHVHGILRGRGLRSDGVHMTSPDTTGAGMSAAIGAALAEAAVSAEAVDAVTLTAPAAPAYDALYANILRPLFGDGWRARTLSWEPQIGHVLGASGTFGLLYSALLLAGRLGPARANVLALSVGFGGLNGATVVGVP